MRTLTIVWISCTLLGACSSDTSSSDKSNSQPSGSQDNSAAGATPAGATRDGVTNGAPPAALNVVFNELAAVGTSEWIEIANKGDAVVDLSGYAIADSDKTTMEPKRGNAMKFPPGTSMDPGARIVIMTSEKKNASVGPHPKADCLPDGPETCFYASFGVSATTGEPLHILDPGGAVVTTTAFPNTLSADAGGSTTETQCRLPDLSGDFTTCAPTPGRANQAP